LWKARSNSGAASRKLGDELRFWNTENARALYIACSSPIASCS